MFSRNFDSFDALFDSLVMYRLVFWYSVLVYIPVVSDHFYTNQAFSLAWVSCFLGDLD